VSHPLALVACGSVHVASIAFVARCIRLQQYTYRHIYNYIYRARRGRAAAQRASLDDLIDGLLAETDAVRTAVPR
jgi:hypothetical protein